MTKEDEVPAHSQVGGMKSTPEQPNEMIFSGDHFWGQKGHIPKYTSKPSSSLKLPLVPFYPSQHHLSADLTFTLNSLQSLHHSRVRETFEKT